MPYVGIKVSSELDFGKELALKEAVGKAIVKIPGKNESSLMVCIEDKQKIYFGGNNDKPTAYVEVKIYGKSTSEAYSNVTAALCEALESVLDISPSRIYVKYEEGYIWGWNGKNI